MSEAVMDRKLSIESADAGGSATEKKAKGAKTKPPKTKLPDIGLASFVSYKVDGSRIDVYPTPRKFEHAKGGSPAVVTLGDVPLPPGVPYPQGLTCLYGFRDHLDEMKSQYALARQRGHELVKVEFKLQVDTEDENTGIIMGSIGLDDLKLSRFLNVMRLRKDLYEPHVLHPINELLIAEAKKSGKAAIYFDKIADACSRPDLLCQVIRSNPVFAHINSVAYQVPDGTIRGRKVCTIFQTDKGIIDFDVRGEPPFEIKLPSL